MKRRLLARLTAAALVGGMLSTALVNSASAVPPETYISSYAASAQTVQQQYGVPASVALGQSILESAWGESRLTRERRNFFGFKCTASNAPGPIATSCHNYPTQECGPSGCHTVNQYFRGYASSTDSFRDYGRLLRTSRYAAAFDHVDDPDQFIREVHRAGYATDPEYANKVISLMRTYNLYRFNTTAPDRPAESVNGDRFEDLVAVDANDVMWMYPGRSAGTFGAAVRVGSGWIDNYNRIAVGDSNGDGFADLFATATDGVLWYWHNDAKGGFGSRTQVGQGWKTVQWFTVADVNGDDKADILAKVGDYLNLYVGTGRGQFAEPRRVGTGWSQVSRFAAGDADGDGDADIWGTKPDGTLLFWKGNGQGGFTAPVVVGGGWQGVREFAVLDVNGDRKADIVGVKTSDNTLIRWTGDGDGTFAAPAQIGHGWSTHRLANH
ncbi:glucosaminidase domain-containing protein [Polymorphospora rubra]|uniref:glucosaminidase domain-containing protein n=1 Tax=Polymorphospora rubra TaxID=338584 RepID=UPI0033FDB353